MFNLKRFLSKLLRVYYKLDRDKRNFHDLFYEKSKIKKNFIFNIKKIKKNDILFNRIYLYTKKILLNEKKLKKKKDMWDIASSQNDVKKFYNTILSKDKIGFYNIINNFGKTTLVNGFSNYYHYKKLILKDDLRKKESYRFLDTLISLAEYKKITKVYNPEQGGFTLLNLEYKKIIRKVFLEKIKKIKIFKSPNYIYGFVMGKTFFCLKDLKSFYSAISLNELTKNKKINEINEIGGGLGYTSYYFNKLNNINMYNLYDIPYVSISQAYFLIMNIKEDLVHLSGEKFNKSHKISIKPYWELFKKRKSNKKILWFNQDSFPEISNDISKKYIDLIASSKKSFLFSINQEAYNNDGVDGIQYPLYYLINNNKNFNLENRSRDFLRKGYIEELYKIG